MAQTQAHKTHRTHAQLLKAFLASPTFIIFILCLILMSYNLVHTYHLRPFNSDDVFWQTIIQTWHPHNAGTVTLGNSSIYVDKIPFFALFDHLFASSRRVLLMEAGLAALAGFSLFYWSGIYFLQKAKAKLNYVTLLPFIWLTSLGYVFSELFLNSNWRGFQLGLSFAVFALVATICNKDLVFKSSWSKILLALGAIYAGLQIYSDPYFLYFTIGPVVIVGCLLFILRKINARQTALILGSVLVALLSAKLFGHLFTDLGIRTTTSYPMEFVQFENLWTNFSGSLHSIIIIFNADFFGRGLKLSTFGVLLNFALLSFMVYKACSALRTKDKDGFTLNKSWSMLFAGVALLIFLAYTLSTLNLGIVTYRYFLMFELLLVLIFSLWLGVMKNGLLKVALVFIILTAVVLNLAVTSFTPQDANRFEVLENRGNSLNYRIIDLLKTRGLTKGFANYWDANINTYFADSKVDFLPSVCQGKDAKKWHWLINDDAFNTSKAKTFYLLNPDVPAACTTKDVANQFGPPEDILYIGDKKIYIYNYDISSRMGTAQ
jgi:hypothetical protein